jgi:hypothetical protein
MSSFPGSPQVMKGAIIGLDPFNPLASVIIFQYNPEKLTRTLAMRAVPGSGTRGEPLRIAGPPEESISVEVDIDATDQLENTQFPATQLGIYPTLASLEMLLYPKSARVIADAVLQAAGFRAMVQPEAPLTLFIWGIKRILPVRITQFTINEEAFDTSLNPIRAKVTLGLRVLNYNDLGLPSAGGAIFMAHQIIKEVMATIGGVSSIAGASSFSLSASIGD